MALRGAVRVFLPGVLALLAAWHVGGTEPPLGRLRVEGRHLVGVEGKPMRLLGVNRSGTEWACVKVEDIFDGPTDEASIRAMEDWNINVVRLPLNETCWLGLNGVSPAVSGANYRRALADYVERLTGRGLYVVLVLHWSAPDEEVARGLTPMPNRSHSPRFWREVALAFQDNPRVAFDLFNEPAPDDNQDTEEAWRCWRDGGECRGIPYPVAGMQELVDTVRATGARNLLLLSGVQYAASLSRWLEYQPVDPLRNAVPSWHPYDTAWCNDVGCWEEKVAPVAELLPLVAGEVGQLDCGTDFIIRAMDWLDARGGSYLGWTWNVWECDKPALIADHEGTPLGEYGRTFRERLRSARPSAR